MGSNGASHGRTSVVGGGRLVLRTDTDYLLWSCPRCQSDFGLGAGLRLVGASSDFDGPPSPQLMPIILAFSIHCLICGCRDFFKLPIDHFGRYDHLARYKPAKAQDG